MRGLRFAAVTSVALVAAGCGGHGGTTAARAPFRLGAFEPPLHVHGALPGRRIALRAPRDVVASSVRELLVSGSGATRVPLYVGRSRSGNLCIGSSGTWECLAAVDAQPVFSFVGFGGHGETTDWGALVGIAAPDVRVTVERQSGKEEPLPLRRFRGFQWAAFASPTYRRIVPDALHFYDRAGHELSGFIDLAYARDPCPKRNPNCVFRGKWKVIADSLLAASGGSRPLIERAKRTALRDPLVRHLLAGRRYSFDPATAWSKCSGGTIGVVLSLHIAPATFTEDWPSADYDASSHTAYVQHVTYYKVARVTQLDVSVDTNERRVVGVDPTNSAPDGPEPQVDEFSAHPVDGGKPGGGPDSGDCSSSGD